MTEVEIYLDNLVNWKKEMNVLRQIILSCGLIEEYKWKHPCYTFQGKNILLIHGFKAYCAVLFNKGALLNDEHNILIQQTKNTQSGRQIRFTSLEEIKNQEAIIKAYIFEAIEVERAGLKIKMKATSDYELPSELIETFETDSAFEEAFHKLTEGRKRGYLLHFLQPKQSKTRIARIANHRDRILNGYGLHDCVCGLSKRKPNCDGSHKQLEQ